jgi:hypothetical protein
MLTRSIVIITALLSGCMTVHSRSNGQAGPNWQRAELQSDQPTPGGRACFFRQGSDTYTITSHNGCPPAVLVDTNSYKLHVNPLVQGYHFLYKCLEIANCPSKEAEPKG